MAAKPAEEAPQGGETLKYQTWALKVLIHCDGCKRRVKKILQGIDGVYTTEVDSLLHKVTVTGNVDAETLIKRLSRSGRVVELWPEKPPEKKDNKKSGKSNKGGAGDANKEKEDQKNSEPDSDGGGPNEGSKVAPGEDSDKEGHSYECEEGGGGGEGGKKKKKKNKKKNKGEKGGSASATPNNDGGGGGEEISKVEALVPSNLATSFTPKDLISPPIQHAYPYPPQVYYPPPPAYELSYNTAYPVSSTASYYVGAPIMPMHTYTTPYARLPPPPPPSDPIKHYVEYEDEHESGGYCSIM